MGFSILCELHIFHCGKFHVSQSPLIREMLSFGSIPKPIRWFALVLERRFRLCGNTI
jgi:hypothetical protein